eukprot:349984-Chlamydomonas_euryale.AAC.5
MLPAPPKRRIASHIAGQGCRIAGATSAGATPPVEDARLRGPSPQKRSDPSRRSPARIPPPQSPLPLQTNNKATEEFRSDGRRGRSERAPQLRPGRTAQR